MSETYKISNVVDTDRFTDEGVKRLVTARFKVGSFGPFQVEVEKTATWDTDLKREIERVVQGVQALQR
jgi:hypothetical protein